MALPSPAPDRAALVTGASSGIGAELARQLAARGHGLVLAARSEGPMRELAEELGGKVRVEVLTVDLTDRAARAALPGRIEELGLAVDILVNNAGFSTLGRVSRSDPEEEMAMVEVDVVTVVDLCSRFLPGMVERDRGAVLNVASTAAFQPLPGQAGYAAGKAFVLSYTQSLVGELRGSGVTATALCPGPVKTGFGPRAGFSDQDAEDALPAVMWVDAAEVARAAIAGLDDGRMVVIPGVANKVGAAFSQVTPRSLLLPILTRSHPGLREKSSGPGRGRCRVGAPPSGLSGGPMHRRTPALVLAGALALATAAATATVPAEAGPSPAARAAQSLTAKQPKQPKQPWRWAAAARCRRSTSTPRGRACGCCGTAATPSTPRWPPPPRSASPSRSAPASEAAATSSTTTRAPAGCTPSTAARPRRPRCRRTRSSTPRRVSRTGSRPSWSPAECRWARPAPPRPGPPRCGSGGAAGWAGC